MPNQPAPLLYDKARRPLVTDLRRLARVLCAVGVLDSLFTGFFIMHCGASVLKVFVNYPIAVAAAIVFADHSRRAYRHAASGDRDPVDLRDLLLRI